MKTKMNLNKQGLDTFIALDIETTGLDFDTESIIELAAVRFEKGLPVGEFQAFLPPGKSLTAMAQFLTGLTEAALQGAPPIPLTLKAFLEFAGDLPLVAHNADFDATFLCRALAKEGLTTPLGPWLDSLLIARTAWPTWDSHRLESLCTQLGFPPEISHRALPDARRAGLLFLAAQAALQSTTYPKTWQQMRILCAEIPGWNQVITNVMRKEPFALHPIKSVEDGSILTEPPQNEKLQELTNQVADSMEAGNWVVQENTPQMSSFDVSLQTALLSAERGFKVLIAVPDADWITKKNRQMESTNDGSIAVLDEPTGYLNRLRLQEVLRDSSRRLPLEERLALLPLVAWSALNPGSRIADCRGFAPYRNRYLWTRIDCDHYEEDSSANEARQLAVKSNVLLVSHSCLLRHLKLEGALLPTRDLLIVSGAHQLAEKAMRQFGRSVNFFRFRPILQRLQFSQEKVFGLKPALASIITDVNVSADLSATVEKGFEAERLLYRFLQKLGKQAAKRRTHGDLKIRYSESLALTLTIDPEPLQTALEEFETSLQKIASVIPEPWRSEWVRVQSHVHSFRLDFDRVLSARNEKEVYWVEEYSNPHKANLRCAPLQLEEMLGQRLSEFFTGGAFFSPAIMTLQNNSDFFLDSIGMKNLAKAEASKVVSRRDFDGHPPLFLMAPFVPAQATMDTAQAFAQYLVTALTPFLETGIFVLFPSQGALRIVHEVLIKSFPQGSPIWAQHLDGNHEAVTQLYANQQGGIVLATEGIQGLKDSQGHGPALVVVTRLPLPPSRDPLWEVRNEKEAASGRNPRYSLWNPYAALHLKQELASMRKGPGEGIKRIWLFDARASLDGSGAYAGRALGLEPQKMANLEALIAKTQEVLP